MTRPTATLILAVFALVSAIPTVSAGLIADETIACTHYARANTESASCNDKPNVVCSQKCTGGVVVDGCSLAQQSSAPLTRQTCSIGFSQTSATNSICVNAQGSFSCTGVPTGQATCSGCANSQMQSTILQSTPALGVIGSSVATVVPVAVASPTPSQSPTTNASVSRNLALPVAQVVAAAPLAAQSIQPAVVASSPSPSQPGNSNSTVYSTVYIPASQDDAPPENDNTTSTASLFRSKSSVQLAVTLGFMVAGVVTL